MYVREYPFIDKFLCGSLDCQTETGMIEIRDPRLERSVALTAADRKWMDDIVNDVNANWDDEDPGRASSMQCVIPLCPTRE